MESTISRIEELFNPRSVAIVGVPRGLKFGKLFLMALIDQGFQGSIYPVNPNAEEIDGLKTYPDLHSIPGAERAMKSYARVYQYQSRSNTQRRK